MSSVIIRNIIRGVILLLLQVFILKNIQLQWASNYVHIIIYPLFILLLPINIPRPVLMIIGFFYGLLIDMFYDSPGLHAAATVFICFIRLRVLSIMEPRGGYKVNSIPTKIEFGFNWFLTYSSIMMFGHLLIYFSLEAFSFAYIIPILIKLFFSLVASMTFLIFYIIIFNPEN